MIVLKCDQCSPEWFKARLGIPTASGVSNIVTSKGKPSTSAKKYLNEKLAEWISGEQIDVNAPTKWMQFGNEMEPRAREAFSFITGQDVEQVGFCTTNDGKLGASPDGLIGSDGGLEIKSVKGSTLVGYYLSGAPSVYMPQIQCCIYVCERGWWDFIAYNPSMVPYIERVYRDDDFIEKLVSEVGKFNGKLEDAKEKLKSWKI